MPFHSASRLPTAITIVPLREEIEYSATGELAILRGAANLHSDAQRFNDVQVKTGAGLKIGCGIFERTTGAGLVFAECGGQSMFDWGIA